MTDLALVAPVAEHPVVTYLAKLAPGSRPAQRTACETLARLASGGRCTAAELQWHRLTYAHTSALRAALAEQYAVATANRHLSALRGVLKECWRLGLMPEPLFRRAVDLDAITGSSELGGRALSESEVDALFASCDDSLRGRRDAALLACLYAAGLRRAEAGALDASDVLVDGLLVRKGKGNKDRRVPMGTRWLALVRAWCPADGALFRSFNREGLLTDKRLCPDGVAAILERRCVLAGIDTCAPHDLRRTYITRLLERSGDLSTVSRLAGHASVRTTQRYDRRGEEAKQAVAALL